MTGSRSRSRSLLRCLLPDGFHRVGEYAGSGGNWVVWRDEMNSASFRFWCCRESVGGSIVAMDGLCFVELKAVTK
jgi:hypothetical protein